MNSYVLEPVGFIRSRVKGREDAPRQGPEGAPDAWLEIEPRFAEALLGVEVGHELIVITWLHAAVPFQLLSALEFGLLSSSPFVFWVTILLPKQSFRSAGPIQYCSY